MSCNCIDQVNKELEKYNTELGIGHSLNFDTQKISVILYVETRKVDPKTRGKKKNVIASYCPFCGKKMDSLAKKTNGKTRKKKVAKKKAARRSCARSNVGRKMPTKSA